MIEITGFEWPKTKTELINLLRWEDDGGQIVVTNDSTIDLHPNQLMLVNEAKYASSSQD